MLSIRENEIAAESCGINITYYKTLAFSLSAAFAGAAGALYAGYLGILNPSNFGFMKSIEILVMVVLGGMGSMAGSVVAAIVLTAAPEALRAFDDYRMIVYSLLLIATMIFKPSRTARSVRFLHEADNRKVRERRAVCFIQARPRERSGGSMNKLVKEPSYNLIPERDLGKTPILECRRIGIDFGGLSAVDEFTIAIGRTEICGIIGPNGAGKTTIFNLLTNVYRPTRGSILVNGVDTLGMTTDEVNRRGVARTFQNIRLFKDLTVEENVLIGLHNSMNYSVASSMLRLPKYWKQEKEARERVRELLHIFHMENMTAQQAGSLPYGAQRRLEIVRSLATNPGILLLDEPAAGMNPSETAELMETIRKIRDEFHIAIMLIEHDMKLVMGICEGIAVLNYGRIIAKGTPDEIRNNPVVIEAYLGKEDE